MPGDLRQGVSPTANRLLDIADGYHRHAAIMGAPIDTSDEAIADLAGELFRRPADAELARRSIGLLIAIFEERAGDGLVADVVEAA